MRDIRNTLFAHIRQQFPGVWFKSIQLSEPQTKNYAYMAHGDKLFANPIFVMEVMPPLVLLKVPTRGNQPIYIDLSHPDSVNEIDRIIDEVVQAVSAIPNFDETITWLLNAI